MRARSSGPPPALLLPGRFRAAVFDFDGLLVDSEPGWGRAERDLLARYGRTQTAEDRRATVGRSIDETIEIHRARIGADAPDHAALKAELVALARIEYRTASPRTGAVALVEALAGRMPIALASNTYGDLVAEALARTPFAGRFRAIATSDEVAAGKPAPDVYLLACERLGVAPADAVAFEDSRSGVLAARAAGMAVVAVPEHPADVEGIADLVLDSLEAVEVEPG